MKEELNMNFNNLKESLEEGYNEFFEDLNKVKELSSLIEEDEIKLNEKKLELINIKLKIKKNCETMKKYIENIENKWNDIDVEVIERKEETTNDIEKRKINNKISQERVFTTEDAYIINSYGHVSLTSEFREVLKTTWIDYPIPALPKGALSIAWLFAETLGESWSEKFDFSEFRTEGIVDMSYLFSDCKRLEKINIEHFDTNSVINMSNMFSYCVSLKEVSLANFDTSNVTNMNMMFGYCQCLEELDINSFDTSSLKDAQKMFMGCRGLEKLELSKFYTENLICATQMFCDTRSLKKLNLSSFETPILNYTTGMFDGSGIDDLKIHVDKNPLIIEAFCEELEKRKVSIKTKKR